MAQLPNIPDYALYNQSGNIGKSIDWGSLANATAGTAKARIDKQGLTTAAALKAGAEIISADTNANASMNNAALQNQVTNKVADNQGNYQQGMLGIDQQNADSRLQELANTKDYQGQVLGLDRAKLIQESHNQAAVAQNILNRNNATDKNNAWRNVIDAARVSGDAKFASQLPATFNSDVHNYLMNTLKDAHSNIGQLMSGTSVDGQTGPTTKMPEGMLTGGADVHGVYATQAAMDKTQATQNQKQVSSQQTLLTNTPQAIQQLDAMYKGVDQYQANALPGTGMGTGGIYRNLANRAAASLGLHSAENAESAAATINQNSDLTKIQQLVGVIGQSKVGPMLRQQAGSILGAIGPSLDDTPEAAKTKIMNTSNYLKSGYDASQMQAAWMKQNNGSLDGFSDAFDKFQSQYPSQDPKTGAPLPYGAPSGAWRNYVTTAAPNQGAQIDSGYYANGKPVSMQQLDFMAGKANTTRNGIIKQYGLSTNAQPPQQQGQPQQNIYAPPPQQDPNTPVSDY